MAKGKKTLPTAFGIPVADDQNSMTAGSAGRSFGKPSFLL